MKQLILIGFRGAGKTTFGRMLASRLHVPFVDTDHEIQKKVQADIPTIFNKDGEAAFRELEDEVIQGLTISEPMIISVGGGAVLSPKNCESIRGWGECVWLDAPVEVLIERIKQGSGRPGLTKLSLEAEARALYGARLPLYEALADDRVMTNRSLDEVLGELEYIWRTL